jgi:hypothetical protein
MKLWTPTRRKLLAGGASLIAAPYVARAGSMSLLGAGKVSSGGGGHTLTILTPTGLDDQSGGTTSSFTVNIGTMAASSLLVVGIAVGGTISAASMTCNGVSLTKDAENAVSNYAAFFSGHGSSFGSGSQTIAYTATGSSFQVRDLFAWRIDNAVSATVITAASVSGTTATLGVTAGDFLFGVKADVSTNFSSSTEAPTDTLGPPTGGAFKAADWNTIISTNASFNVVTSGADALAVATYR